MLRKILIGGILSLFLLLPSVSFAQATAQDCLNKKAAVQALWGQALTAANLRNQWKSWAEGAAGDADLNRTAYMSCLPVPSEEYVETNFTQGGQHMSNAITHEANENAEFADAVTDYDNGYSLFGQGNYNASYAAYSSALDHTVLGLGHLANSKDQYELSQDKFFNVNTRIFWDAATYKNNEATTAKNSCETEHGIASSKYTEVYEYYQDAYDAIGIYYSIHGEDANLLLAQQYFYEGAEEFSGQFGFFSSGTNERTDGLGYITLAEEDFEYTSSYGAAWVKLHDAVECFEDAERDFDNSLDDGTAAKTKFINVLETLFP